jgi:hypothetical protein
MAMDHLRIERLRDERRLLGQVALFWLKMAATDDDLDPRIVFSDVMGEREPVRVAGHIDIREEQGDGVGEFRQHGDRSIAVIRLIRAEACIFENACDIHEDERVIIDRECVRDRRCCHGRSTIWFARRTQRNELIRLSYTSPYRGHDQQSEETEDSQHDVPDPEIVRQPPYQCHGANQASAKDEEECLKRSG